jgi:hypothetical protein
MRFFKLHDFIERLKRVRQPAIGDFVKRLQKGA